MEEFKEDDVFELTPWALLREVLISYKVDVDDISGRVGKHIVEDFMDLMMEQGYARKVETP